MLPKKYGDSSTGQVRWSSRQISINEKFKENSYNRIVNQSGAVVFLMLATRIGEPEENYLKAKSMEGVHDVILDLIGQTHDCSRHIDKMIDENRVRVRKR